MGASGPGAPGFASAAPDAAGSFLANGTHHNKAGAALDLDFRRLGRSFELAVGVVGMGRWTEFESMVST